MPEPDEDFLYEAVQLSEAVFSKGREVFDENYEGEVEAYMLIQDIRNRIEIETMDQGEMIYPEDLPDFEELGGEEVVKAFYDFSSSENGEVPPEVFVEYGLIEEEGGEFVHNTETLAYLSILDEVENIVSGYDDEVFEAEVVEPEEEDHREFFDAEVVEPGESDFEEDSEAEEGYSEQDQKEEKTEEERKVSEDVSREEKVDELSKIWDNVAGTEE